MSNKELARLEVLRDLDRQRLTAAAASSRASSDLGRRWPMGRDRLEDASSWQVERTLSQSLTLQHEKVLFILDPTAAAGPRSASGSRSPTIPDGALRSATRDAPSPAGPFDKNRRSTRGAVVENGRR